MQVFFQNKNKILKKAVILNFDGSLSCSDIDTVDLRNEEEKFRYFTSLSNISGISSIASEYLKTKKIFHIGNGDLHHISYAILCALKIPDLHIVVFDNHPDNMIFPFGIHCGSWVYHAAKLPFVSRVSVIGITSKDISGINILQNRYYPLRNGKVNYYCLRKVPKITSMFSKGGVKDIRNKRENLHEFINSEIIKSGEPVYLSIDKDVLSESSARSTWDQGVLSTDELMKCIDSFADQIVAADICGEISECKFKSFTKRLLRAFDGNEAAIENRQNEINKHFKINNLLIKSILQKEHL